MGKLEQQVPNCKSKEIKSRTTGNENIPSHTNEVQDADTCNCCSYEGGGGYDDDYDDEDCIKVVHP